jgi:tetratricopeptide (TPR) repeat protein
VPTQTWIVGIVTLGMLSALPARLGGPAPTGIPVEAQVREAWADFIFAPGPETARAFAKAAESAQGTGPKGDLATNQALHVLSESAAKLAEGLAARGPDLALLPYATACLRLMAELLPDDGEGPAGALTAEQRLAARQRFEGEYYGGVSSPKAGDAMEAACCASVAASGSEDPASKRFWIHAAIPEFERALAANGDSWRLLFELGWAQFQGVGDFRKAAEYFARAEAFADCPVYVYRLYYRCYEHLLDLPSMFAAMEEAKRHGLEDEEHQRLVQRDIKYWRTHEDDPQAHRATIIGTNYDLVQWGASFILYPDDPFWVVCPHDGLPSPKGSETCQHCGRKLK